MLTAAYPELRAANARVKAAPQGQLDVNMRLTHYQSIEGLGVSMLSEPRWLESSAIVEGHEQFLR